MSHKKIDDIYNVHNYTEKELLDMLDLYNPSDRELEAKIIQMVKRYESIGNDAALKIADFYKDIYDYFFPDSDEENVEYEQEEEELPSNKSIQEGFTTALPKKEEPKKEAPKKEEPKKEAPKKEEPKKEETNKNGSGEINSNAQNILTTTDTPQNVTVTQSFQYTKDKINPVLKETIKRIISIDSQFREVKLFPITTSFTFNLSEPLKDVVSLKLYSVQIPYTWYTINNNFGSNFFYLKGNSDGINTGNYDIKIAIPAGNYTPTTLTTAVNKSITGLRTEYSDISFGTTQMIYNDVNSKTTISVDIKQIYNQSEYYLYFPNIYAPNYISSPYSVYDRLHSIQAFLGFENNVYAMNSCYSSRTIPLSTTNDRSVFDISINNNYFTIYNYGVSNNAGFDISTSYILNTVVVQLDPTVLVPGNQYTRNQINAAVNTALLKNKYIDTALTTIGPNTPSFPSSRLYRIDVSGINEFTGAPYDLSTNGLGESYYELSIKLNRFTTDNEIDTRSAVVFPNESGVNKPIWTGGNSAFQFLNLKNELNYIYSESYITNTNYVVGDRVTIQLICNKEYYGYLPPEMSTFKNFDTVVIPIYPDTFQMSDDSPVNYFNGVPIHGNIYLTNNIIDISLGQQYDINNSAIKGTDDYFNPYLLYTVHNFRYLNYIQPDGTYILYTYGINDPTFSYYDITLNFGLIDTYQAAYDIFNAVLDICYNNYNWHLNSGYYDLSHIHMDLSGFVIDYSFNMNKVVHYTMDISSVTRDLSGYNYTVPYVDQSQNNVILNLVIPLPPIKPKIVGNLIIPNVVVSETAQIPLNNYNINIVNSNVASQFGYTLNEYVGAINYAINNPKGYTDSQFPVFDVKGSELLGSVFYIDPNTSFPYFNFKINRHFDTTRWTISLSTSYLFYDILGGVNGFYSDPSYNNLIENIDIVDLSVNRTIYSRIPLSGQGYTFGFGDLSVIAPNQMYATGNFFAPILKMTNNVKISQYQRYGSYLSLQAAINTFFRKFVDNNNNPILYGSNINMTLSPDGTEVLIALTFNINVYLTQDDYSAQFIDPYSGWTTYLGVSQINKYNLYDLAKTEEHIYSVIKGGKQMFEDNLTIDHTNNTIYIAPAPNTNGLSTPKNTNNYTLTIPNGFYSRDSLLYIIQQQFLNHPSGDLANSIIMFDETTLSTLFKIIINKVYTGKDYILDFYDPFSFSACIPQGGTKGGSIGNTSWDSTLGWIFGFRLQTVYTLTDYAVPGTNLYQITGDTSLSVSIYSYFMIILDDYIQNRLNDGLVTTSRNQTVLTTPSYLNKAMLQCDPVTGQVVTGTLASTSQYNNLTQKQIYSAQTILQSQVNSVATYSSGPFSNDVFALVPMKVSGMQNNSTYIEFGGTLQNQERAYFGPVNITRMSIQLVNDKGELVDLNGSNWSFSLLCEQLYQNTSLEKKK
jgi:hypothetical protein